MIENQLPSNVVLYLCSVPVVLVPDSSTCAPSRAATIRSAELDSAPRYRQPYHIEPSATRQKSSSQRFLVPLTSQLSQHSRNTRQTTNSHPLKWPKLQEPSQRAASRTPTSSFTTRSPPSHGWSFFSAGILRTSVWDSRVCMESWGSSGRGRRQRH